MRAALLPATLLLGTLLLAAGCGGRSAVPTTVDLPSLPGSPEAPEPTPLPGLDPARIEAGAGLYAANCAGCHGADLAGAANWKTPNPDGTYPPPPMDSSGHTWHHGDGLLTEIVLDGSAFPESTMPSFGDRLGAADVAAILEFFKSTWGPRERDFQWEMTLREQASG